MSYWDDRTSKKDACDMAELEAKNDVLRQLGLERLKSIKLKHAQIQEIRLIVNYTKVRLILLVVDILKILKFLNKNVVELITNFVLLKSLLMQSSLKET